jgi:NADPH-dependent glutamate synthase beta subunit-like oxidoreductase
MEINLLTSLNDNIRIDREKCNACGRCVEVCVLDNLRLQLSPCRQACPLGMNCQGYVRLLSQGKVEKGLEIIRETVPFGGILGRICSRPCEAACNRIKVDEQPVAIRDLKRFLTENNGDAWLPEIHQHLPQKVAIIGAGPAGLTAAYSLRIQGFQVTLYDKESAPGGMLRWAIPEFRLPINILERELLFIQHMGIEFLGGHTLGGNLSLKKLIQEYDAILLALGAHGRTKLGIQGEEASQVFPVLQFMKKVRQKEFPQIGKKVVVIGGGNAAVDAAQTSLRLGAQNIKLVSLEKKEEMPAFAWGITEAEEEGIQVENGWGPSRFHLKGKKLAGITFKKCTALYDSKGSFSPMYDEKTTFHLPADSVIVAIGQRPELEGIDPFLLGNSGISYDPITFQTPNQKIFSAGDFNLGSRTVVEAMAQGKEAALSIQRFLQKEDLYYGRRNGSPYEYSFEPDLSKADPRPRVPTRSLPISRRKGFQEIARGYSKKEALAESERCLNCGMPFGLRTCWFCLPCEIECHEKALYVEIPYLLR